MEATERGVLAAAVFIVPLIFVTGTFLDAYNIPKLAVVYLATGIAAAAVLARLALGGASFVVRAVLVPAAALVLPLLLAWLLSPYRGWALFGSFPRFQGLVPYLAFGLLTLLLYDAFRSNPLPLVWGTAGAGALVGLFGLMQMVGADPLGAPIFEPGLGPPSTIGQSNFTGGYLACALPMAIYLWSGAGRSRYLGIAFTVLIVEGILLSNSQGAWGAGLAGASVVAGALAASRWPGAIAGGRVIALLAAVGTSGVVVLSLFAPGAPLTGGSVGTRGTYWETAVRLAAESPLVGHGPNVYAIEGVRFRPLEDAVVTGSGKADDPHSVPLAFLANAGLVGFAGFCVFATWTIRAGVRLGREQLLGAAMFGAAVAYLVQSLVSIDEPTIQLARCVAVAGLAGAITRSRSLPDPGPAGSPLARVGWGAAAIVVAAVAIVGTTRWIGADSAARKGQDLFTRGQVDAGRSQFARAIGLRSDIHYRSSLGRNLGLAALDRGVGGAPLIEAMRETFGYLEDIPESSDIFTEASLLHHWSEWDEAADEEALSAFRRGLELDPNNVLARIEASEVLIDLGREEAAADELEPYVAQLNGVVATYWGGLSIARLESGDLPGARDALSEGMSITPTECRVRAARILLRVAERNEVPDASDMLTAAITCDPGFYAFFLDRLPPDIRAQVEDS